MEIEEIQKRNRKIGNLLKHFWGGTLDILECKTKIQDMFNTLQKENEELRKDKKLWIDRATQMQQETLDLIKEVNSHKLDKAKLKERERTEKSISRNLELIKENTKIKEMVEELLHNQPCECDGCEKIFKLLNNY